MPTSVDVVVVVVLSFVSGPVSRVSDDCVCSLAGAFCAAGGLARIERSTLAPEVAYRVVVTVESALRLVSDVVLLLRVALVEASVAVAPVCTLVRSLFVDRDSGSCTVVEKISLGGREVMGMLPFDVFDNAPPCVGALVIPPFVRAV